MASNIDPTKPTEGTASTSDVRANFDAAKTEIEALQAFDTTTLSSTANGDGAALIGIEDAAANFTSTNVEGALAETLSNLASTDTDDGTKGFHLVKIPLTDAELAAGVTPTKYEWQPGDIRRYGAVGDWNGTTGTDNTTAINNALLCNSVVFIPEFSFAHSGVLNQPAGVHIYGFGYNSHLHSTNTTRVHGIAAVGSSGSELTGLSVDNLRMTSSFDNNGITTGNAIRWRYVDDSFVSRLWAWNWSDSGVSLTDCDRVHGNTINIKTCSQGYDVFNDSTGCTVDGLIIDDIQTYVGLNVEGLAGGSSDKPTGFVGTNIRVTGCTTHGINILNSIKPQISAWSVSGTTGAGAAVGNGMEVYGCELAVIGSGIAYDNAGYGIIIGPTCDEAQIVGVTTDNNTLGSLLVTDGGGIGTSYNVQVSTSCIFKEGAPTLSGNASIAVTNNLAGITVGNSDVSDTDVLDWYLEGTFTPVVIGDSTAGAATYTTQLGKYTRIGNRIFFEIQVSWSAHTGTGNIAPITGLPYAAANTQHGACSIYNNGFACSAGSQIQATVTSNDSTITINQYADTTGAAAALPLDTAVADFRISGNYTV